MQYHDPQTPEDEGEKRYLGLSATQLNLGVFAVAGAIALAVWLALFGGVGDLVAGGEEETAAVEPMSPEQAATSAVLTLSDLPPGWTAAPPDDDDDESNFEFSAECDIFNLDTHPDAIAIADSDDLEGPTGQQVSSDASVFPSANVAQGVLDTYAEAITRCRDELLTALEVGFREGVQEGGGDPQSVEFSVSMEDVAVPSFGDWSGAYRVAGQGTADGTAFEFTIDSIIVRVGSMVGGVTYIYFGQPDTAEEQQIAQITTDKLAKANTSLSES